MAYGNPTGANFAGTSLSALFLYSMEQFASKRDSRERTFQRSNVILSGFSEKVCAEMKPGGAYFEKTQSRKYMLEMG